MGEGKCVCVPLANTQKRPPAMGDRPPAPQAKEGGATIFRSLPTYPCVRERRFPALEKRAAAVFLLYCNVLVLKETTFCKFLVCCLTSLIRRLNCVFSASYCSFETIYRAPLPLSD